MSSVTAAKKALRKAVKLRVAKLSSSDRQKQSATVIEKVMSLPQYVNSSRVCLYLNMPDEVQTETLLQHALDAGKTVYIPRYVAPPNMDMVKLSSIDDYFSLPLTAWNIRQPDPEEKREDALHTGGLDMMLVPGLAFGVLGERMGRGKGYYDSYLQRYQQQLGHLPILVGLAFNQQLCDHVPREPHDQLLDLILQP